MDTMWDILGISTPTADIRQIKTAYAVRLKALERDRDADAISDLHRAFKEATEYSKTVRVGEAPMSEPDNTVTNTDTILEAVKSDALYLQAREFLVEENAEKAVCADLKSQCFEKIYELLNNPWKRVNEKSWRELFDEFTADDSDFKTDFPELLRKSLLHHYGYFSADGTQRNKSFGVKDMPARVSTYIFHRMGWLKLKKVPVNIQNEIDWLRDELDVGYKYNPSQFNPIADKVSDLWEDTDDVTFRLRDMVLVIICFVIMVLAETYNS